MLSDFLNAVQSPEHKLLSELMFADELLKFFIQTPEGDIKSTSLMEIYTRLSLTDKPLTNIFTTAKEYESTLEFKEDFLKLNFSPDVVFIHSTSDYSNKVFDTKDLKNFNVVGSSNEFGLGEMSFIYDIRQLQRVDSQLLHRFKIDNNLDEVKDFIRLLNPQGHEVFTLGTVGNDSGMIEAYELVEIVEGALLRMLAMFTDAESKYYMFSGDGILLDKPVTLADFKQLNFKGKVLILNYGLRYEPNDPFVEFEQPLYGGYEYLVKYLENLEDAHEKIIFDVVDFSSRVEMPTLTLADLSIINKIVPDLYQLNSLIDSNIK